MSDRTTATLTVPVAVPASSRLEFYLWYDTEPGFDFLYLEASRDDGKTWTKVPFSIHGKALDAGTTGAISGYEGHQWLQASADLSVWSGPVQLRWRYATDQLYHGRGVYVDAVEIRTPKGTIFNSHRPSDRALFWPDGWVPSLN